MATFDELNNAAMEFEQISKSAVKIGDLKNYLVQEFGNLEEIQSFIDSMLLGRGQRDNLHSERPIFSPKRNIKENVASTQSIADRVAEISGNLRGPQSESTAIDSSAKAIASRIGQAQFREALFENYGRKCMITGEEIDTVIEAAHIRPYSKDHNFDVENGLLLRSDLHTLFDLGLLVINPDTFDVVFDDSVKKTPYDDPIKYGKLHVEQGRIQPDKAALCERYKKGKDK